MSGTWWLSWADGAGGGRKECSSEEHAMAEEAAMRLAGKRDVVAWLDSESQGPWKPGDAAESHRNRAGSAEEVETDPSYTSVISRPSGADFGEVA